MNFQQLEYIVAVDEHGKFAVAAAKTFVSQPTLSMMIQKLEEELGVEIFNRSERPVVATSLGRNIIDQARIILQEAKKMREMIAEQKQGISGEFRLAIIPTLAPYLLPLFLGNFTKKYPDLRLYITEMTTEQIMQSLRQDQVDAALLATPLLDVDLSERPLFNESFVVFASESECLPAKKYLLAKDVNVDRLMLLEEGHCLRSQIINLCELRKSERFINNVRYEAGSLETLKKMVQMNAGLTILPELAIWDLTEEQMDMVRYFKDPAPMREISLVTRRHFIRKKILDVLSVEIIDSLPEHLKHKRVSKILSPF